MLAPPPPPSSSPFDADSQSSALDPSFGQCCGVLALMFIPFLGTMALALYGFRRRGSQLRALIRAAMVWNVLLSLLLLLVLVAAGYAAFFIANLIWAAFSGLAPVK